MKSHEPKQNRTLNSGFAALRSEYSGQPPRRIEDALRARIRERNRHRHIRNWAVASVGAAAAALLLLLIVSPSGNLQPAASINRSPALAETKPLEAVARVQVAEAPVGQARPSAVPGKHRIHRRPTAAPALRANEQPSEFLAIPYSEPLAATDQVDVYRVRMPRVTLARFGLPMAPGTLDSAVTADVAVGGDGVARAIRFVR